MALRCQPEIEDAHNVIGSALKALRSVGVEGEFVSKLEACQSVLCWVLLHPAGDRFDLTMIAIDELMQPDAEA